MPCLRRFAALLRGRTQSSFSPESIPFRNSGVILSGVALQEVLDRLATVLDETSEDGFI
jgi:hypothetical protein